MTEIEYIIKPAGIIRDKRLSTVEGDYLCFIAGLEKKGGCIAGNQYFADFFGVKRTSAVEVISKLKKKNIISTIEKKSGGKTIERTITIIDPDSRKHLLLDSRESLPLDSRQNPSGIVGNADRDSRQNPNHILSTIISYDINSRRLINISSEDLRVWKESYPHVDVEHQIKKMEGWLYSNPKRRPKSDYPRFINSWLAREKPQQNKLPRITREVKNDAKYQTIDVS